MRYVGGKYRLWKHILPIMLEGTDESWTWWEPFVGSAVVLSHVPPGYTRIGSDANGYIIALHNAIRDGWEPPEHVSEETWKLYRRCKFMKFGEAAYDPAMMAFVGFGCSFGARWFEGYARSPKTDFNHAAASRRNLLAMAPLLKGAKFYHYEYDQFPCFDFVDRSVIYCDPPYRASVKDYYRTGAFDHDRFWNWCLTKASEGARVFVSEFDGPSIPDARIKVVWEKSRAASLDLNTGRRRMTEKLFRVYSPYGPV